MIGMRSERLENVSLTLMGVFGCLAVLCLIWMFVFGIAGISLAAAICGIGLAVFGSLTVICFFIGLLAI